MDPPVRRRLPLLACTVDLATGVVSGGRDGRLTSRERTLLSALVERAGQPVSRADLFAAFGYHPAARSRAVDKAMNSLRAKIERDTAAPDHLVTIHGVGYAFHALLDLPPLHGWPGAGGTFVGRVDLLWQCTQLLDQHEVVVLTGPAGSGKTRLGVEICRQSGRRAIGVELGEAKTSADLERCVRQATGTPRGGLAEVMMRHPPGLWLLDGADDVVQPLATALSEWRGTGHRFLVTSRQALPTTDPAVAVGPLADVAAIQLLQLHAGVTPGDPAPWVALARALDGLPWALEIAAAQLRSSTPERLLERVREHGLRDVVGVHPFLKASWDRLEPAAATALVALSVFVGGAPLEAVDAVLRAVGVADSDAAVTALMDASLVSRRGDRLTMLGVVGAFARSCVPEVRAAAEVAHGVWASQRVCLEPGRIHLSPSFERVREELPNLRAAHRRAVTRSDGAVALATSVAVALVVDQNGPATEALPLLDAASEFVTTPWEGVALFRSLAVVHRRVGEMRQAADEFEIAVRLAREGCKALPSHAGAAFEHAQCLLDWGWVLRSLGSHTEATSAWQAAQQAAESARALAVDDPVVDGRAGKLQLELAAHSGRWSDVVARGPAVVAQLEAGDQPFNAADVRLALARALRRAGRPHDALPEAEAAAESLARSSKFLEQSNAWRTVGCVLWDLGQSPAALEAFQKCLVLDQRTGAGRSLGNDYCNVGEVLAALGRPAEAMAHYMRALALLDADGNHVLAARTKVHLAALEREMGELARARAHLADVRPAVESPPFDVVRLSFLEVESALAIDQGDLRHAEHALDEALARAVPSRAQQARLLALRARSARCDGDVGAARGWLVEARALLERVHAPRETAIVLEEEAEQWTTIGAGDAFSTWRRAHDAYAGASHRAGAARCRCGEVAARLVAGAPHDELRRELEDIDTELREIGAHRWRWAGWLTREALERDAGRSHAAEVARVALRQVREETGLVHL